ncbi:YbaN family protein [Nitrospira sp. MA-1]|nr:YbaN family protein [Nitrospira sp. MA-1]
MPVSPVRLLLLVGGWISLGLGLLGIFVPLVPTTPFILLAAWCFSKSSPRLHAQLLKQPLLGPMIQNWEQEGSISRNAKLMATACIIALFGCSLLAFPFSILLTIFLVCIGTGVLMFIWTRPKPSCHLNQLSNRTTDTGKNLVRLG